MGEGKPGIRTSQIRSTCHRVWSSSGSWSADAARRLRSFRRQHGGRLVPRTYEARCFTTLDGVPMDMMLHFVCHATKKVVHQAEARGPETLEAPSHHARARATGL